ncbi:MAG: TonB-dependent receptor, partial [Gemmatimonadetes bacterium]
VQSFQVLDDPVYSPFATGLRQQYGGSVSGGADNINFFVSAEWEGENGPYELPDPDRQDLLDRGIKIDDDTEHPQQIRRVSVRANVTSQLGEDVTLDVRTGYVTSNLSFTGNDNNSFGFLPSAYFGGSDPDNPDRYWGFQRPAQLFGRDLQQNIERFTASSTATWSPLPWLTGRLTGGIDYTNRQDLSFFPRDIGVPGTSNLGSRNNDLINLFIYTVDASATANFDLNDRISSKSSVGVQFFRNRTQGTLASGFDIVNGAASLGAAAQTQSSEFNVESKTAGIFFEQQFGLDDRLFVTGAVRADDNSTFGKDFDLIWYPKFSLSWMATEEPFFPEIGFLDQLRLRVAWGKSGRQPGTNAALQTLSANAITTPDDETASGVSLGEIGNTLLEPEKSSEIELGFDADLFNGRIGLELTYYDKDTEGALVQVPLAPSLGGSNSQWVNIGKVENKGWEASLFTTLVDRDDVRFELGFNGSINDNELTDLGDLEPIGAQTRFVEGYPLGGQWAEPIESFNDANGDGIIDPDELVVGDTAVFVGPGLPEKEFSLTGTVTLFDRVRLYGLLDWRGDYVTHNFTEEFRCRFRLCRGLNDPTASPFEQARAQAAVNHPVQTSWGYLEDGSFFRLREVSLTFFLPESWANRVQAQRASLTLTGRNLGVWTDYTGIDPEVNFAGAGDNFGTTDFLTQPPLRYWTARVNLSF